jgi:uncharacterized membrane protein YccC
MEVTGLRTAIGVVLPLLIGQLFGFPGVGMLIGIGALYIAMVDKDGATIRSLLATTAAVACSVLVTTVGTRNPAVDVALMFLVAFGSAMLGAISVVASNIGFAVAVSFAILQGVPGNFTAGLEHMGEFLLGGLWATGLTLVLWRITRPTDRGGPPERLTHEMLVRGWRHIEDNLCWRSQVFRHAMRVAVAATIAVALYRYLHLPHGTWLILTVLVIVKQDYSSTRQRAFERVMGSLVGGAAAILLVAAVHNKALLDLLLTLFCILAYSQLPHNYGLFVVFLTPFVVLLINMASPGDWHTALIRMGNTLGGGALALIVAFLLRPRDASPTPHQPCFQTQAD